VRSNVRRLKDVMREYPDPADRASGVYLHFDDGSTLIFYVTERLGFAYDGVEVCDYCDHVMRKGLLYIEHDGKQFCCMSCLSSWRVEHAT
jgi:hypothetical protein